MTKRTYTQYLQAQMSKRRRVAVRGRMRKPMLSRKKGYKRPLGANTQYRYSRYATDPLDIDLNTTSQGYGTEFALQNVKGYTDFSGLYDSFIITGVQMRIQLITNPNSAVPTNNPTVNNPSNWYPKIWYVFDNDDSVALSLSQIRERQGVKCVVLQPNKTHIAFVKPCVAVQTYRTGATTGYAPKRIWLDMATGYNVPHYGFKYVLDANGYDPSDTYPFRIRVEYKYFMKFKGVL